MKNHSIISLLCAAALSYIAPTLACSCEIPSLESTLNSERGTVFRGKVTKEVLTKSALEEYDIPKQYLVRVVLPYKGSSFKRNDHVIVSTAPDDGLCGVTGIEEGDEYLFSGDAHLLVHEEFDNIKVSTQVEVDICSSTHEWKYVSNSEKVKLWHFPTTPQEQLNNARSKWLNFRNYDYAYDYISSMPPPTKHVQVREGKVKSVTFEEHGFEYKSDTTPVDTVQDTFDIIQRAINRKAHDIQVNYHDTYGYPSSVYIDYEENIADEEFIARISDLTVLSN